MRRDRVGNAARSLVEDWRADDVHSGSAPLRSGSRDLVRRTHINHGLDSEGRKKALVRLQARSAAAEEHSPTNVLSVAARVGNGRAAADVTEVEHTDLRHSPFSGDDPLTAAAF